MTTFNKSNDPNPSRLIESLRHIGYSNYEAIADILDNSFDAEASTVSIELSKVREDFEIAIADDGTGMDHDTLDQALRLGSLRAQPYDRPWQVWDGLGDCRAFAFTQNASYYKGAWQLPYEHR
ncbi:MAG: ATP-binding protein [Methyloceanibacter sp.]|nr:ATP-binding protein [Methyloceanibacter sp.]